MTDKLNTNLGPVQRGTASIHSKKEADEKVFDEEHIEGEERDAELQGFRDLVEGFPDKEKRKLLLKMDLHIIPILISLYRMSSTFMVLRGM